MWIFFNDGILDLKIPVLTTYLRTMWKLARAGYPLSREKLVEGKQKPDTLSDHLNSAARAGLIYKIEGKKYPSLDGFRSEPNEYVPLNVTHKIQVKDYSKINDFYSYTLQKILGKEHTDYYNRKYGELDPIEIQVENVTVEDRKNRKLADSLEAPHLSVPRVITFTKLH